MVAVAKRYGGIRICVDLKPLNESVRRQPHPPPTVEGILSQLSGAKVLSKLDANSGFWQIPLNPSSRCFLHHLGATTLTSYHSVCPVLQSYENEQIVGWIGGSGLFN